MAQYAHPEGEMKLKEMDQEDVVVSGNTDAEPVSPQTRTVRVILRRRSDYLNES